MSRVYSAQLCVNAVAGGGTTFLATVPAGTVWVLRDMRASYSVTGLDPLAGFEVLLNAAIRLWTVGPLGVKPVYTYPWEGRTVLDPGDELSLYSGDSALWSIVVSGYALTLP